MEGIRLGPEEMKFVTLFESLTNCKVRDCLIEEDGEVTFVVDQEDVGKCLGREGRNIRTLCRLLGKSIHVVGYSSDFTQFVKNLFLPAPVSRVLLSGDGKTVTVEVEAGHKGMALGRGKKRLARAKRLMARHFGVKEVIVKTGS
jgi:N utilization substance protein A